MAFRQPSFTCQRRTRPAKIGDARITRTSTKNGARLSNFTLISQITFKAKASSVAEVHAVRGGQLILRVAPQRPESANSSRPMSRKGSLKSVSSLDAIMSRDVASSLISASGLSGSRGSFRLRSSRCYLTEQTMDILEKILAWLSPRDLALMSLTSKTMNFIVRSYVDHFCNAHNLHTCIMAFHETNENVLLPKEIVFRDRLESNRRPQLLLYSARNQYAG